MSFVHNQGVGMRIEVPSDLSENMADLIIYSHGWVTGEIGVGTEERRTSDPRSMRPEKQLVILLSVSQLMIFQLLI